MQTYINVYVNIQELADILVYSVHDTPSAARDVAGLGVSQVCRVGEYTYNTILYDT